jgi:hypothetical protein
MKLGRLRIAVVALVLPALLCHSAAAQSQKSGDGAQAAQSEDQKPSGASTQKPATPAKPMTPAEARQAQLMADTQRLYQLTQELKEEVAKSNKDTLSVPVVKKAEEVEKLARSLKERMRQPQ